MKKIIFLVLVLSTTTSIANDYLPRSRMSASAREGVRGGYNETEAGVVPQPGEITYNIINPTVNGTQMTFIKPTSPKGLCNYLGYENFVKDSVLYSEQTSGEGVVLLQGNFFSYYVDVDRTLKAEKKIRQIICVEKLPETSTPIVAKFNNPTHRETQLPISAMGDYIDPICYYLGFDYAIANSWFVKMNELGEIIHEPSIQLKGRGEIDRYRVGPTFNQILCVKYNRGD
ncbi:MAG: hypothetical protein AB7F59_15295 [Bdellovibrionales bacterium]